MTDLVRYVIQRSLLPNFNYLLEKMFGSIAK